MPTEKKLTVSVVGAGRLGTALARALHERGYHIEALVARTIAHARRAARLIGDTGARPLAHTELDQLPSSDLIFITTPDDLLAEVAAGLSKILKRPARGKPQTVLHASGVLSSEVLSPLRERGFRTGSMHPLVAVSDPRAGAMSLRAAFYCVEGERGAVRVAREVVRALGGESFSLDAGSKALYHAAAVVASGHTVALLDIAIGMLSASGLSRKRARMVLLPLVRSTLENLSRMEPERALTGTFARADATTVRRHLKRLKELDQGDALAAYVLLGQHSLRLAEKNGVQSDHLEEIARLLDKASIKRR